MNNNWHSMNTNEIFKLLDTNKNGLSSAECKKRIKKHGKNILPRKKENNFFKILLKQTLDPIVIILFVATGFSFIVGEFIDAYAIIFIIMIDLLMGTFQEFKAERNAKALESLIKDKTIVIRDGKEKTIDSTMLVVGDIIKVSSGEKISADVRIIESANLTINESVLTGESNNISKNEDLVNKDASMNDKTNILFAGTTVSTGRALCVVVETGVNTEIGKIASKVLGEKETKSPLTIRMNRFTKQIAVLIVFVAIIITLILIFKNTPGEEVFLSVIALSVSAMPEGLPLALTMALTIGANRMGKKNVIVKKLNSVESLGSCTVIATDKTGTLTVNEQTAKKIVLPNKEVFEISGSGYNDDGEITSDSNIENIKLISKLGIINNEATLEHNANKYKTSGDSIDIAFLALGLKAKVDKKDIKYLYTIPYESENKASAVYYEINNEIYCTVKGSVEVVSNLCDTMAGINKDLSLDKKLINKQNEDLAKDGYRIIAVANGKVKNFNKDKDYELNDIKNLNFEGLVAFIDPIREEVKESIKDCTKAGIKTIMITGDHPLTSFSIAKELELVTSFDEVTTGEEVSEFLKKDKKTFDNFVKSKKVFTRITPMDKLEIVSSLKRNGEFVAVTGDGVNDAPALKTANIGVSMGSGTDVAKETSNMIILDDNFKSIVTGIKEGRNAYSNIRKVIYMLLSSGFAEVLFFCLAILFNMPIPLLAIQLLWLNIVTDGLQDFALSFEKAEENIMNEKPRSSKESVFDKELLKEVFISSVATGLVVFGVWLYLIKYINMDVTIARGYVVALMVFLQNIHVLNCRSEHTSVFKIPIKSNPLIIFSITGAIILQFLVMEVPILSKFLQTTSIPIKDLIILFFLSFIILIVMEIYKKINKKKSNN